MDKVLAECPDIPCIVGGKEVRTGKTSKQIMPSNKSHTLCTYHQADQKTAMEAAHAALEAKTHWENLPFADRASVFLKAADLLATKYRAEICAATMLGTGKNVWQAEVDCTVETIDFWRFGVKYATEIYAMQPPENDFGVWNRMEYRPLEGFVLAVTPFNFLAIGANLNSSPNIMGNTTVWKPADTTILGSWLIYKILKEAGLPDGVVNFVPGQPVDIGKLITHPNLGGLHFTGSTKTFNHMWKTVADNLDTYHAYPRVVGETGGKNFHVIHESADVDHVVNSTVRGAFEYQGQKCSATSRMYVPSNLWPQIKEKLVAATKAIKQGCVTDFEVFMTAVIDETAFDRISKYIADAKASSSCEIIAGGGCDKSKGFFVEPTIIETTDMNYTTMREEIFGPVLTIYVYDPAHFSSVLTAVDKGSSYALTGSIFAQDRYVIAEAAAALRNSAGNFYINDKSTGSIVGQQPFGGSRKSGTNDKSGSCLNLLRWTSARAIKETFIPTTSITYPSNSPLP
eukprot:JP446035.1.p1 GENE.JP446035.1~~JP446035.1.p1  ORF type:complete len:572 (-),score=198.31 JP446035.1:255-1793(-)